MNFHMRVQAPTKANLLIFQRYLDVYLNHPLHCLIKSNIVNVIFT